MKHLLVVFFSIMMLTVSHNALAQCPSNNCPPDDGNGCWFENNCLWTVSPGCQIDVDYCYRYYYDASLNTWIQDYYVDWVGVESGCDGISIGTLMGEVASQLFQTMSTIPECGASTGELVAITSNSCWEYNPLMQVENEPTWRVYGPCGTGTCTKTCSICFGYSLACGCYEDQLGTPTYTSNYTNGSCTEGAPNCNDWAAYTCYHMPCSW